MIEILKSLPLADYAWVLAALFGVHELEEWNILDWYERHYVNLPPSTKFSTRLHIAVLSLAALGLILIATALRATPAFGAIFVFFSLFVAVNALQHVAWSFQTKSYSPGLATGLLLVSAATLMNLAFVLDGLIDPRLYAMAALAIPPLVDTLRSPKEMTKAVLRVHRFFIRAEALLRAPGKGA
jgi:hypothetical protein